MSLIARCPACGTLFRVVPDQLKISDGWVRCGKCAEVFDANHTLQQLAAVPTEAPAHDSPASSEEEPRLLPNAPSHETPQLADAEAREPVLEPGPLAPGLAAQTDPGSMGLPLEPPLEPPWMPPPSQADPALAAAGAPDPLTPSQASVPSANAQQDVSFVRQAQRRAFWRRRGVRLTLAILAGALAVTLAAQVAYHQRDRLASQVPVLQPVLVALCEAMSCRLGAPQRIEAIAIESSAFTRLRADAFRLNLTLNNQAEIALAVPALELTLTDLQDQPVLRRVLQPADLGPDTPAAIAARTEWSSTLTVVIAPGVDPARIVGYRVLAFYP